MRLMTNDELMLAAGGIDGIWIPIPGGGPADGIWKPNPLTPLPPVAPVSPRDDDHVPTPKTPPYHPGAELE